MPGKNRYHEDFFESSGSDDGNVGSIRTETEGNEKLFREEKAEVLRDEKKLDRAKAVNRERMSRSTCLLLAPRLLDALSLACVLLSLRVFKSKKWVGVC